jgi:hypothetical protein
MDAPNCGGPWLCMQLAEAAENLDPDTWAKQAGKSVREGLIALGLPTYMAEAPGACSGVTLKIAFGHTPIGTYRRFFAYYSRRCARK